MRVERWFYTVQLRVRSLFRRRQLEQELDRRSAITSSGKFRKNIAGPGLMVCS